MAIENSDGSIILSTKIDTSGIKKGFSEINSEASSTIGILQKVASAISVAFAVKNIIQFSKEASNLTTQTEASVRRLIDIYGEANEVVGDFIDQNARALGMSKAAAASFSSVYGNLFSAWADQATNAELTNEYLKMTAVIASKTGRTVADVQERIRSGLLGNTEAIEDLGIFVNVKTIEMTDAFKRMADGKSWEQLDAYTQQQIRTFAILEQSTKKYGDQVEETTATIKNRYNAAYEDFKESWGRIVNTILIPILETLTKIFDIATRGLNALSGTSDEILDNSEDQMIQSDKTADNIEDQAEAEKNLNKEMQKTLANFDDIQILSKSSAENVEELGKGNFSSQLKSRSDALKTQAQKIDATLTELMIVVELAAIAIGLVLLSLGQVGWGLGFIIGGAATLNITSQAVSESNIADDASRMLQDLGAVVGISMLAIGLILIFLGQVPWGLGFVAFGAAEIGISEVLPTTSSGEIKAVCEVIEAFLAALLGYLIANALLSHLTVFVDLWGKFKNLIFLINQQGLFNVIINFFQNSLTKVQQWAIALGTIVAALMFWVENWDDIKNSFNNMSAWEKAAVIILGVAAAIAVLWVAITVGVAAASILAGLAALGIGASVLAMGSDESSSSSVSSIPDGNSVISSNVPNLKIGNYNIPKLATGTVVPPNREFLAVLGDNKQETEIVSPISTMKQAVMEAMAEASSSITKEEHYYLSETELMSIIFKLSQGGKRLNGYSLEDGGV